MQDFTYLAIFMEQILYVMLVINHLACNVYRIHWRLRLTCRERREGQLHRGVVQVTSACTFAGSIYNWIGYKRCVMLIFLVLYHIINYCGFMGEATQNCQSSLLLCQLCVAKVGHCLLYTSPSPRD